MVDEKKRRVIIEEDDRFTFEEVITEINEIVLQKMDCFIKEDEIIFNLGDGTAELTFVEARALATKILEWCNEYEHKQDGLKTTEYLG